MSSSPKTLRDHQTTASAGDSVDFPSEDNFDDSKESSQNLYKSSATTMMMQQKCGSMFMVADSLHALETKSATNDGFGLPVTSQPAASTTKDLYSISDILSQPSNSFSQTSPSSSKKDDVESDPGFSLVNQLPLLLQEQYDSLDSVTQQQADTIYRESFDPSLAVDPSQWFQSFLKDHHAQKEPHHQLRARTELGPTLDSYDVTPITDDGLFFDQNDLDSKPPPGLPLQHDFSFADLPDGYLQGIEDTLLNPSISEDVTVSTAPPFQLKPTHQQKFDALSEEDQRLVVRFCAEMGKNQQIRDPAAFCSRMMDKFIGATVPPFELPKKLSQHFDRLSPSRREKARSYCLSFARGLVARGRSIRNASAYYGKVFQSFCNNFELEAKDDVIPYSTSQLEFLLPKNRQKIFQSLPKAQQEVARKHCLEAAHSVLSRGHSIRNPSAYFGNVFDSIRDELPSMVLTGEIQTNKLDVGHQNDDSSAFSSHHSQGSLPSFILQPNTMKIFQALPQAEREKVTAFCIHQAQTEIGKGTSIRHPAAFYSIAFRKYQNRSRKEEERAVALNLTPPAFEAGDHQLKHLNQLPTAVREAAMEHCHTAALTVLETGQIIRNPRAFYTRHLNRFFAQEKQAAVKEDHSKTSSEDLALPPFILPMDQNRVFDALSSDQRTAARTYCVESARQIVATQNGTKIEDSSAFYGWVFHRFFEDQLSSSLSLEALKDAPGLSLPSETPTSTHTVRRPHPPVVVEQSTLLSTELLQRELKDTQAMLQTKVEACEHLSNLLHQEQERSKLLEQEVDSLRAKFLEHQELLADVQREKSGLQARSKLMAQLEQRSKTDQAEIASLKEALQAQQDKYNSEAETFRKMTATFASVSDELCRERSARRKVEDELQVERKRSSDNE